MPKFNVTVSQLRWEHITVQIEAEHEEAAIEEAERRRQDGTLDEDDEWDCGDVEITAEGLVVSEASPGFWVSAVDEGPSPLRRMEVAYDQPDPEGRACWVRRLFVCEAESEGRAIEQCLKAHPGCRIVAVRRLPALVAA